ncbi:MAG: hypothetical protein Q9174_005887 [Haloplaca sp. 1 TL-2023]
MACESALDSPKPFKPQFRLSGEELSDPSTAPSVEDEVRYYELRKIPLRRQHFRADMKKLSTQFATTMTTFRRHVVQRLLARKPLRRPSYQHFVLIHAYTNSDVSIKDLYYALTARQILNSSGVLVIFPVVEGVWELIVEKDSLRNLLRTTRFDFPIGFAVPENLPPGIVARVAQLDWAIRHSGVVNGVRVAPQVYRTLLGKYSWNRILKDTAESFALEAPTSVIVSNFMYIY